MEKNYTPLAIVIAGLIIAGAVYFKDSPAPAGQAANVGSFDLTQLAPVEAGEHRRGNPNATITIVEYSDLECPFCKIFHQSMSKLLAQYGDSGQVAWVYRHFPLDSLHPQARQEAEATECAAELGGNEKFWAFTDRLFEVTPANNGLDLAELPKIAVAVGLEEAAFKACLESGRHAATVNAQFESGQAIGVDGTPFTIMLTEGGTPFLPFRDAAVPEDWGERKAVAEQIMTDLEAYYRADLTAAQGQ
jgi:protein-disulfide isomerase